MNKWRRLSRQKTDRQFAAAERRVRALNAVMASTAAASGMVQLRMIAATSMMPMKPIAMAQCVLRTFEAVRKAGNHFKVTI